MEVVPLLTYYAAMVARKVHDRAYISLLNLPHRITLSATYRAGRRGGWGDDDEDGELDPINLAAENVWSNPIELQQDQSTGHISVQLDSKIHQQIMDASAAYLDKLKSQDDRAAVRRLIN